MKRREFVAAAGALGLLPLAGSARAKQAANQAAARANLELRTYQVDTPEQREGFETFCREAAIPALNRLGIGPVGVFYPAEGISPIYVLLPHKNLESAVTLVERLSGDSEFLSTITNLILKPAPCSQL